ncbi:MAG TPA: glycosyltransferase family 39 protein [Acidisarcina sp.]
MAEAGAASRATGREGWTVAAAASLLSAVSLLYCAHRHLLLLYGDAVAHLHIARRVVDSLNPGYHQLGSVWLPLPHILLLPFVLRMDWWQSAVPAAVPSMLCYVAGCVGIYRLARLWLQPAQAAVALAFYSLNPGLLYMQTTAMTEPLFLAEMIWAALLLAVHARALAAGEQRRAGRALLWAGLVLVGAVYTRYDGWIYGCFAWLIAAANLWRHRGWFRQRVGGAFVLFTVILAVAPAIWIAYNACQFGDPLDFMRGPYSARAIETRTAVPGSGHYPGWHSMPVASLYFLKAAEGGAAPVVLGNVLLWLSVAGTVYAAYRWREAAMAAALLLWIPLPFYAYSVAYGSVPIHIPLWWPHSWYNTRYGMEMLPAFALAAAMLTALLREAARRRKPQLERWIVPVMLAAIGLDCAGLALARPLVLQEAFANSETRIPFERSLAKALLQMPAHREILMYTSAHIGALQQAGILLRGTTNEGDYYQWNAALRRPAAPGRVVVAIDGDPVALAVAAHPEGLRLLRTVCSEGQPCARIYTSAADTSAMGR